MEGGSRQEGLPAALKNEESYLLFMYVMLQEKYEELTKGI